MTINVPEEVEDSIQAAVRSGHFASVDDAMTEAALLLLRQITPDRVPPVGADREVPVPARKPIWEVFEDVAASIPDEEWAKLPADGAEQHDHYLYGAPKRPMS